MAGLRSYAMGRRLVERGHQVIMVCGSYRGADTGLRGAFVKGRRRGMIDGLDVIEINLPYSNEASYLRRTRMFLAFAVRSIGVALTESCDLVFATSTPLTVGIPGIFARWLRRKRFVFEVRDLWPELPQAMGVITNPAVLAAMSALEWLSYRSADRLIGLSPGIVEGVARRGIARNRIAMIPNACHLDVFKSESHGQRPDGVNATDLMAVFAGTHGVANGLDAVLDAAGVLKERGNNAVKIVLVGDGALKRALMQRATERGLDNLLFRDPIDKQRVAELLAAADIGLQILANVPAFYYGTSPNKFFDYLAAGLPVLTNYPGWLADIIRENGIGYAIPPDDAVAFADALERAHADRAALAAMGRRALALAHSRFDSRKLADGFVDWLEATVRGEGA
jgi:glycosyltransferase involved in cell wall biosynthesis